MVAFEIHIFLLNFHSLFKFMYDSVFVFSIPKNKGVEQFSTDNRPKTKGTVY